VFTKTTLGPLWIGLTILLGSCSGHSLTHEELKSDYRAAASLSAESEQFLQHLPGHPYNTHAVDGHWAYLRKQGTELRQELEGVRPEAADAKRLSELRETLSELNGLLAIAPSSLTASDTLESLRVLRRRLEEGMPQ
jgi:hypothetical protein